ncbi:MAG: murein biosynthesis integral membrane protein MurJ [Bdellovibrionales bacterium]|nr:murein biosynthesis integral membrane protein MurJ [Bdellovibrionales bacterium]
MSPKASSLAQDAGRMSAAVLLSRLLGLVREQVFAALFGASWLADAYQVAFRIPSLFRALFAEGALSMAFVTVLSRTPDLGERRVLVSRVLTALSFVVGLVCLALAVSAPWITSHTVPAFALQPGKLELTTQLLRLFAPFLYFASVAALAMGTLNTLGSFFIPSLGSAAFNVGSIVLGGGLALGLGHFYGAVTALWAFAGGTLFGGLLQWLIQWPALLRRGIAPWAGLGGIGVPSKLREALGSAEFRAILWLMAPSVVSVASVQISNYIGMNFAAGLEPGSVSWIYYSFRLLHFPMGLFGVALSTAALPRLAAQVQAGERKEFVRTLDEALSYSWILALGATVGLIVFREPIVALVYQHGRFGAQDTLKTSQALLAYALGLVAFIQTKVLVQAYYALNRVWVSSASSVASIGLSAYLNHVLARSWGHAGIPLSSSLSSLVVMLVLLLGLRWQDVPVYSPRFLRTGLASVLGAFSLSAFSLLGVPAWLMDLRAQRGQGAFAAATLASLGLAGGAYLLWVVLLSTEGRALLDRLKKRFV